MLLLLMLTTNCPTLDELRQAALRKNAVDPRPLEEMTSLLRKRHLIPDLSLSLFEHQGAYVDPTTLAPTSLTNGWGIQGHVDFRLSQLVFDSAEINLQREKVRTARLRREVLQELHENYFQYLALKDSRQEEERRQLVVVTAKLEDLTGAVCTGGVP